jgi:two-component system, NtrC family, response regulator PilR
VALESGAEISTTVLPDRISGASIVSLPLPGDSAAFAFPAEGIDFDGVIAETEKRYLQLALEKADGVRTRAAELLKISYRSFRHLAKKHEL